MEICIPVPCCQEDARFGPCGMGVCENAYVLYDYFHGGMGAEAVRDARRCVRGGARGFGRHPLRRVRDALAREERTCVMVCGGVRDGGFAMMYGSA